MFFFRIDSDDLNFLKTLDKTLAEAAKAVSRDLAQMSYSHALELAQEKLHSRRQIYIEALSVVELSNGEWSLQLDAKALWIEDGMDEHSMLDGLLSSKKAKRAKDGSTYMVVPFKHGPGKGAGSATPAQMDLINTIKSEMRKKDIPWKTIETDANGKAKEGKLHTFDISNKPKKTKEGPGQGHGPIGEPKQGPTGIPFLQGVNIYQRKDKATGKMTKSVMTFRVASSKHRGQGRWQHPGLEKTGIMDDTLKWASDTLDTKIAPKLASEIDRLIS